MVLKKWILSIICEKSKILKKSSWILGSEQTSIPLNVFFWNSFLLCTTYFKTLILWSRQLCRTFGENIILFIMFEIRSSNFWGHLVTNVWKIASRRLLEVTQLQKKLWNIWRSLKRSCCTGESPPPPQKKRRFSQPV